MEHALRQRDEARMVAYTLEKELRAREQKEPSLTIKHIPEESDAQNDSTN